MTQQNFGKPEMTSAFLICSTSGFVFECFLFSKMLVERPKNFKKLNFIFGTSFLIASFFIMTLAAQRDPPPPLFCISWYKLNLIWANKSNQWLSSGISLNQFKRLGIFSYLMNWKLGQKIMISEKEEEFKTKAEGAWNLKWQ